MTQHNNQQRAAVPKRPQKQIQLRLVDCTIVSGDAGVKVTLAARPPLTSAARSYACANMAY